MRPVHVSIAALVFASTLLGCRTVWVHQNWEQGLFEKDQAECRAQAAAGRSVTRVHTRRCTVDSETGDEICIEEETRKPAGPRLNWKTCLHARGWESTTDFRASATSRPKRSPSSRSRPRLR